MTLIDVDPGGHEWDFRDSEVRTVLGWAVEGRSTLPSRGPGR